MTDEAETRYDKIIGHIRKAAGGGSSNEAIANVALAQALLDSEIEDRLLALLVKKGYLTQEEVDDLEKEAQDAYQAGMRATAEKNPDIASKI